MRLFLLSLLVFASLLVGRMVVAASRCRIWLVVILGSSSLDQTSLFHDILDTATQKDIIDLTDNGNSGTHATQPAPLKIPPTQIAQQNARREQQTEMDQMRGVHIDLHCRNEKLID